ncbi:MAG: peptidylprolyl isomerase [Bacteroidota bacterium]
MIKKIVLFTLLGLGLQINAQTRIKLDGVATVVGKNIVLNSEIEAFKQELLMQSDGKAEVNDCEMLEQIMNRKLLAHHAVIDSVLVSEGEINERVQSKIQYFTQQLGSPEKMLEFYGFESMKEMNNELYQVEKEALLIGKMQQEITADIDITPEEVKRYYISLEKDNNLPEIGAEIELAQIVLNIEPSAEVQQQIIDRLNEFKKQIEGGESFKMKAILYSDDPGVSQNSGLYTITRQSPFVKEFKEAAFSLNEGEISEPFKSDFGYHILVVEKIKGKERDARHLLLQPKIDDEVLNKSKDSLNKIRLDIMKQEITFEDAVLKYSNEKETRLNKGMIMNPVTSDTHFELTKMDPDLYSRVSNLKPGEYTDVFYEETRQGKKMYKFILLKSKTESHIADLSIDYVKIKDLALQKKKQETIEKWSNDKIEDTYIKINDKYKDCNFNSNWTKK